MAGYLQPGTALLDDQAAVFHVKQPGILGDGTCLQDGDPSGVNWPGLLGSPVQVTASPRPDEIVPCAAMSALAPAG
jgi:hypothetical protein